MNKILFVGILVLVLSSVVYAENKVCYTDRDCEFISVAYNGTGSYYDASSVLTTLVSSNGTVVFANESMTKISTGQFSFNYTIENKGSYIRESVYDGVYYASEEIVVEDFSNEDSVGMSSSNNMLIMVLFLFLIGLFVMTIIKKN